IGGNSSSTSSPPAQPGRRRTGSAAGIAADDADQKSVKNFTQACEKPPQTLLGCGGFHLSAKKRRAGSPEVVQAQGGIDFRHGLRGNGAGAFGAALQDRQHFAAILGEFFAA